MKRFHKFQATLLVAVSLVGLASCGPKKSAGIKVLNWGTEQESKVWQQLAADFTAKTGIAVDVETAEWSVYWDKINTLYAAKTPPEVFAMDAPLFMDWYSRGALASIQPYLDKEPGFLEGVYPQTLAAYKTEAGYYGLPRDFQTIVLFYNKDMFDAAGLPYPDGTWTFDDLRKAAKKLTVRNADGSYAQWGFTADLWDIEPFMSGLVWGFGGDIVDTKARKTLIGKNMDPWNFVWEMVHVDKSIPDQSTAEQYGSDLFFAGKAAMITMGHWTVPEYSTVSFKWDVAPFPQGPAGRATSVNSAGFVMAKDSKNPDAGWQWIKYVLSEVGQSRLAELGFAIPVRRSIAESPAFLEQPTKINHKVFLDALTYARMKPVFVGYDPWSSAFGDAMAAIWEPDSKAQSVVDAAVSAADAALSK